MIILILLTLKLSYIKHKKPFNMVKEQTIPLFDFSCNFFFLPEEVRPIVISMIPHIKCAEHLQIVCQNVFMLLISDNQVILEVLVIH